MTEPKSLIDAIRLRPAMYIGDKSLRSFQCYLHGFEMACRLHQIEDNRLGLTIPPDFHDWVAYRTHFKESTSGWCNMIVATTNSEQEAFDRFFELINEHSQRTPKLVAEILNSTSRTTRVYPDGREVHIAAPERVRLVQYTDDPGFFALFDSQDWADRFYPYLSWMYEVEGGELVIHDEESYRALVRDNEERAKHIAT